MATTTNIPSTQNTDWGFWGTIDNGKHNPQVEWNKAFIFIKSLAAKVDGKAVSDEEIRGFLDSKSGRHLANGVIDQGSIETVNQSWTIIGKDLWFPETIRAFRKASW